MVLSAGVGEGLGKLTIDAVSIIMGSVFSLKKSSLIRATTSNGRELTS